MTGKTRKRPESKTRKKTVASLLPAMSLGQIEAAQRKHEQGITARGEAVEAGRTPPAGATHEIVGHRPDGTPILKRIRFSLR